jgi:uncharacterized protein
MTFALTRDAEEFSRNAQGFLEERVQRNVLATVLIAVLDGRHDEGRPLFAYTVDGTRSVAAVALRTPPFAMLASELEPADADELIGTWLREDPELPGVNAVPVTARALAESWSARTGGSTRRTRSLAMHALEQAQDPPRPPAGGLRPGRHSERPLLVQWCQAFAQETGSIGGAHSGSLVDARLEHDGLFVWDDGGPVSIVAMSPPVAGVVRIGPVYTPHAQRRRGYAGMAVAAASRRVLAEGARSCMLFTDVANPTSNKIYAEVGYRRFGDWEEHAFERRTGEESDGSSHNPE